MTTEGILARERGQQALSGDLAQRHELDRRQHLVFEPRPDVRRKGRVGSDPETARGERIRCRQRDRRERGKDRRGGRIQGGRGPRRSLASEPPVCSVSARSSAVSRDARNHAFHVANAGQSARCAAARSRHATAASPGATTHSRTSPIQTWALAASRTSPDFDRPFEALRITVSADRQRRACDLQQADQRQERAAQTLGRRAVRRHREISGHRHHARRNRG